MRKKRNGFTSFMRKQEGSKVEENEPDYYFGAPICTINSHFVGKAIREIKSGRTPLSLWQAFPWKFTQQGFAYWCDIAECKKDATVDDLDYLRYLMRVSE